VASIRGNTVCRTLLLAEADDDQEQHDEIDVERESAGDVLIGFILHRPVAEYHLRLEHDELHKNNMSAVQQTVHRSSQYTQPRLQSGTFWGELPPDFRNSHPPLPNFRSLYDGLRTGFSLSRALCRKNVGAPP